MPDLGLCLLFGVAVSITGTTMWMAGGQATGGRAVGELVMCGWAPGEQAVGGWDNWQLATCQWLILLPLPV